MLGGATAPSRSEQTPEVAREPTWLGEVWVGGPGDESIAILIPLAPRKVVAEDCGIGLCLITETECQVAFDKTFQRLGNMRRRLKIVDNTFEAVHRGQVLTAVKIITTDLHFLTGEMISGKIKFKLGITRIFAVRKTTHHIIERLQGLLCNLLVAANIANLDIIGDRLQIIGVSNVTVTRMQLDDTIRSDDRLAIISRLVFSIGRHNLAFRSPDRIGMLALDFVKSFSCRGEAFFDHLVHGFVVKIVDRLFDIDVLL